MPNLSDTAYRLSLVQDILAANGSLGSPLAARNRIVYVTAGSVTVNDSRVLSDNVWYGSGQVSLTAGDDGATLWRWEVLTAKDDVVLLAGSGVGSTEMLTAALAPISPAPGWLLRCDSVAFPPGACAYTHTHPGPGIRCLIEGAIRIDTDQGSEHFRTGEAWYEAGPEPVFAQAADDTASRFIRVMALPPEVKGQRTVQYMNPEDADKPRLQTNRIYCETALLL